MTAVVLSVCPLTSCRGKNDCHKWKWVPAEVLERKRAAHLDKIAARQAAQAIEDMEGGQPLKAKLGPGSGNGPIYKIDVAKVKVKIAET